MLFFTRERIPLFTIESSFHCLFQVTFFLLLDLMYLSSILFVTYNLREDDESSLRKLSVFVRHFFLVGWKRILGTKRRTFLEDLSLLHFVHQSKEQYVMVCFIWKWCEKTKKIKAIYWCSRLRNPIQTYSFTFYDVLIMTKFICIRNMYVSLFLCGIEYSNSSVMLCQKRWNRRLH